jgi:hypothetical protein
MTNRMKITGAFFLLATLAVWTATPRASTFTVSCGAELEEVGAAIATAVFEGRKAESDRSNLLAKLENAAVKVGQAKYADAADKLLDISDTATALAGAEKPKLVSAEGINTAVIAAIACVGALE